MSLFQKKPNSVCSHCFMLKYIDSDELVSCAFSNSEYAALSFFEPLDTFLKGVSLKYLYETLGFYVMKKEHPKSRNDKFYAKEWIRSTKKIITLKWEYDKKHGEFA